MVRIRQEKQTRLLYKHLVLFRGDLMPGKIPNDKYIDINTVCNDIDICIDNFLNDMNIDRDYKSIVNIKHSTINYLMSYIYQTLFKPNETLCNNQKSYIDYNNIELLSVLANKFINICQYFNKSLGLISFGYMIGVSSSTLYNWLNNDEKTNPKRLEILKYIQDGHKVQQIAILNDTPVGALSVANNDHETGLEWSKQQNNQLTANTVYLIPSERVDKLKLTTNDV